MGCNATAVVWQWEVLRSINYVQVELDGNLPLHAPIGVPHGHASHCHTAGTSWASVQCIKIQPIFSSPAATAPESFKPPTSPTHAKASPCFPTLQAPSAASALSPWPSPPPTPRRMQRARAAMTRHTRPTTTLTHRVRVPAQDTPQRIKKPTRLPCAPHPPLPARGPCAHDNDDAAVDGEATLP
ncbi:hypothetical protein EDB86DRAFT_2829427 [Lactarius hatsudake]|nr:hypothetical protein EDB86DRAFT_2829427 [Lactarius hatsudake]